VVAVATVAFDAVVRARHADPRRCARDAAVGAGVAADGAAVCGGDAVAEAVADRASLDRAVVAEFDSTLGAELHGAAADGAPRAGGDAPAPVADHGAARYGRTHIDVDAAVVRNALGDDAAAACHDAAVCARD